MLRTLFLGFLTARQQAEVPKALLGSVASLLDLSPKLLKLKKGQGLIRGKVVSQILLIGCFLGVGSLQDRQGIVGFWGPISM